MTIVFDTETTGLADFSKPPEHECQPRLVQLGALLLDSDYCQWLYDQDNLSDRRLYKWLHAND